MGFLDHSTNNIIIDAVLTERGRELLSRNNGLSIAYYSFGDDEVDYSSIKKYGKTNGKEKIEKNTPILEANTNENLALRSPLISLNSRNIRILYIPKLSTLAPAAGTVNISSFTPLVGQTDNRVKQVQVISTISSDEVTAINSLVSDERYVIKMPQNLIRLYNGNTFVSPIDTDTNDVATYEVSTIAYEQDGVTNSRSATFSIRVSPSLTNSQYQVYGNTSDKTKITTQIEVQGASSGSVVVIPVIISQANL